MTYESDLASVNMKAHALAYARKGWKVFPLWWPSFPGVCACGKDDCSSVGKHPIMDGGVKDAIRAPLLIAEWWDRKPNANIGLACGEASGFTVLDIDGQVGIDEFAKLRAMWPGDWSTPVAITGGGGRHVLLRYVEGVPNRVRFRPGLDVRSSGGHIVAPPSMHGTGERYRWHSSGHPAKVKILTPPAWLTAMMVRQKTETAASKGLKFTGPKPRVEEESIGEGGRNQGLFKLACRYIWEERDDVPGDVRDANQRLCSPPLGAREVERIISSAMRHG